MIGGTTGLVVALAIFVVALCIGAYVCAGAVLTGGGEDFDRDTASTQLTGWGLACLSLVFAVPAAVCLAVGLRRK